MQLEGEAAWVLILGDKAKIQEKTETMAANIEKMAAKKDHVVKILISLQCAERAAAAEGRGKCSMPFRPPRRAHASPCADESTTRGSRRARQGWC